MTFILFIFIVVIFFYAKSIDARLKKIERETLKADVKEGVQITENISPIEKVNEEESPVTSQPENAFQTASMPIPDDQIVVNQPVSYENRGEELIPTVDQNFWQEKENTVRESEKDKNLEFKLGGKMFTIIGAVAVILGIGFFLRYAFENDLISETARVVMGIIAGLILLGLGEYARKKFGQYGQILTGTGIGILYLSLFSAYGYYHIISQTTSFVAMILVTIVGVYLAIRYNSILLAVFAQIGGLLTPIVLSSGENHPHILFPYLILLSIGIIAIAFKKLWRPLIFISFLGTLFIYLGWLVEDYQQFQFAVAHFYASLFFLIYLSVFISQYIFKRAKQDTFDLALIVLNSGSYFLVSYYLINNLHSNWMGAFTFLLAILHFAIALFAREKQVVSSRFRMFYASIGIILTTLAIPIQFDRQWISISWFIEALVFTYLGFKLKTKYIRIFADIIYLVGFFKLIAVDISNSGNVAIFNDRVLSFTFAIVSLILAAVLYKKKVSEVEKDEYPVIYILTLLAGVSYFACGSAEILKYFSHHLLAIFWSVSSVIITLIGLMTKNIALKIFSALVVVITMFRIIFFDLNIVDQEMPILNVRFLVFFIVMLSSVGISFMYKYFEDSTSDGNKKLITDSFQSQVFLLFAILAGAEIFDFFPHFWFPVVLSLIAFAGGAVSLMNNNILLRTFSYLTFIVVLGRILNYESRVNLNIYTPILNARFFSFVVFSSLAGLFSYFIKRSKNVSEIEKQYSNITIFLAVNFSLLTLLSLEMMDYFRQKFINLPENIKKLQVIKYDNLKNVSLSVGWTMYSIAILIIGIIKKSKPFRLLAMFLLGIVIFKVFLYDTSSLSTLYKFISFLTLGVILLLTGFLYNKYRERITQFINT